jgi:3',5'-cyclic AMP phosphodiesterase CpdA
MLCAPGTRGQGTDTLSILHTSDTHIVFSPEEYPPVLARLFTGGRNAVDSLERFFRTTPTKERADALVITGDILAGFEGESLSGKMLAGQIEQLRPLLEECPVPLLLTLGNHDLSSYALQKGDSAIITSQTAAGRARASWIWNIPCFATGTYYTRIFEVGNTRYHVVFLDDGYSLHDGGRRLEKAQLDWLTGQIEEAGEEPVVVFHHIYFAIGDVNHDGVAFDMRKPVDWPDEEECQEGFLKVLNEHRNIRLLVVGHGHENVFEKIRFPGGHSIYQVETGSVTEGSGNWRLLRFTDKDISVSKPGSRETQIVIELSEKGQ